MRTSQAARIVVVVRWFPTLSETFVVRRVLALLDRGWDVHVACESFSADDWAAFPELARKPDLRRRVHTLPRVETYADIILRLPGSLIRGLFAAPWRTVRYLIAGWRFHRHRVLRKLVEDSVFLTLGPHLLHYEFGHLMIGHESRGELLDCAVVASFQGYDLNYIGLEKEPGYYDEVWRRVDAVHFVSRDLEARAVRRGYPADGRGAIVLNGIDPSRFNAPVRDRVEVGSSDRPVRILSVGRLHWKKGYEYALLAIRSLVDAGVACEYRIVGEGEHRDAVLYTIADLALDGVVDLVGPLPQHEIPDQMSWADLFLHPAVSEGFCLAVAEAQAMALPVVTSDADGLRENVIDGVTGFVVPRRDSAAMVEKLKELSDDPDLRRRLGQAGPPHVATGFRIEAHVAGMEDVYRSAIERGQRRYGGEARLRLRGWLRRKARILAASDLPLRGRLLLATVPLGSKGEGLVEMPMGRGTCYLESSSPAIDYSVFHEIFVDKCYRTDYGGRSVLDLGAHKGYFGAYALLRGASRVVSYEPEALNFAYLERTAASFRSTGSRWEVKRAAVGSADGEAALHIRAESWAHSLVERGGITTTGTEVVSVVSLERVLQQFTPSDGALIVKMDIEGSEGDLVMGTPRGSWSAVGELFVEIEPFSAVDPSSVLDRLAAAGFRLAGRRRGGVHHLVR